MKNLQRILAIVALALLLVLLVGGIVCTVIAAQNSGLWPLYVFVGGLLVFAWDNIYGTIKWLVQRIFER